MKHTLDIQELAAVVVARNHNPTILNPDFLKYNNIVPANWELAESPLCTPPVAQVKYTNGISIVAQKIDQQQVRKVARLSRLELTDNEVQEFTGQLEAILEYVEKMNELQTGDVEPLAHCLPITNVFRDDQVRDSLGADKALANAPDRDESFFKVPKILDDSSGA